MLAVAATSFTAVSSQQAVAQAPNMLDASLCESTDGYKPEDGRTTDLTVAQCKALVKFRNDIFAYEGHSNLALHNIAQWGTGTGDARRMNNWLGLDVSGSPFLVRQINISHWVQRNGRQNRNWGAYLYGPIPNLNVDDPGTPGTDSNLFRDLTAVYFTGNRFTGEFPEWIYNLPSLNILQLGGSALSGTVDGQRFLSTKLRLVNLSNNAFRGSLPDFKFRDSLGQAINTGLTYLRLNGNAFTGPIPAGYSAFADGRAIKDLNLAVNRLTGDIPDWVKNVKFGSTGKIWNKFRNRMSFAGNRLCIPDGFTMPTLYEAGTTTAASVQVDFVRNRCPTKENDSIYSPPPVTDMQYEIPPSNDNALRVSWKPLSGSGYIYWVRPAKLVPDQIDDTVSLGEYCNLDVTEATNPPDSNGFMSATIDPDTHPNNVDTNPDNNCRFDPNKFAVAIRTIYEVGGPRADGFRANSYTGPTGVESGWNIVQVKERRSVQDIGFKIGLSLNNGYYSWDANNQDWVQWALADLSLDSVYLEPGTAIITQASRPPAWLAVAGLSSADEDLPIQISNGWNMISAGGDATRPDDDDGAFFFDDISLLDCDSNTGVLVVLRYTSRTGQFDPELPCHPSAEAALTARGNMDTIEELEEYDSLFVYFSSVLPVNIVWDATNNKYITQ